MVEKILVSALCGMIGAVFVAGSSSAAVFSLGSTMCTTSAPESASYSGDELLISGQGSTQIFCPLPQIPGSGYTTSDDDLTDIYIGVIDNTPNDEVTCQAHSCASDQTSCNASSSDDSGVAFNSGYTSLTLGTVDIDNYGYAYIECFVPNGSGVARYRFSNAHHD